MRPYPLSQELRQAIERLFVEPAMAYATLGADRAEPDDWYEPAFDASVPAAHRASLLRAKLEKYIQQMAQEHEEMGSPEASDTLRMQAIGLLIALRELSLHFPELQEV
jgi:hypothetical protein